MLYKIVGIILALMSSNVFAEQINVKYRTAVETDSTGLIDYETPAESAVLRVLHDEEYGYLLISLKTSWWGDSETYHYCGVPKTVIEQMVGFSAPGRYYYYEIREKYDCRSGGMPPY